MEICRRISQPGLKFLKLLTLNVLKKETTSTSSLWNKKIKKKKHCGSFLFGLWYPVLWCTFNLSKAILWEYWPWCTWYEIPTRNQKRNTKLNNLTWFPLGLSLKFLFRLWGRSFVIVMAKIQHTMAVPQNNMIFFFNYYWESEAIKIKSQYIKHKNRVCWGRWPLLHKWTFAKIWNWTHTKCQQEQDFWSARIPDHFIYT